MNTITPNYQPTFKPYFKANPSQLIQRTILWDDAVALSKNKNIKVNPNWKKAIETFKIAKEQKKNVINDIVQLLGEKVDTELKPLIDKLFSAFESGKIEDAVCFKKIDEISEATNNYDRASRKLEAIKAQSIANLEELAQAFVKAVKLSHSN